jgi:hypothetical protein
MTVKPDPYWPGHYYKNDEIIVRLGKTLILFSPCTKEGVCDPNSHRIARCLESFGLLMCLKRIEYRPGADYDCVHRCNLPEGDNKPKLPPDIFKPEGANKVHRLFRKLVARAAWTFKSACSPDFYEWLYQCLKEYKEGPYDSPEQFWPRQTRKQLSSDFTTDGEVVLAEHMPLLAGEHVGFVLDAYTLHFKHMIAALLVTPHLDHRPLLVYLVQASNEQASYAEAGRYLEMFCRFFFLYNTFFFFFFFLICAFW